MMTWHGRRGLAALGLALALCGCGPPDAGVMAELDRVPAVQAIKRFYPDDYQRLDHDIRALGAGGSVTARQAALASVVQGVILRQRPKADADSAYGLYAVTRAEGAALRQIDPAGCASFLEGRGAASLGRALTPELVARDSEATTSLLAQTRARPADPAAPLREDDLVALMAQAASTLPAPERATIAAIFKAERDPATAEENRVLCDFDLALADLVLARPKPEAGALVRSIWALQATATQPAGPQ
jgi:hypothetical protein